LDESQRFSKEAEEKGLEEQEYLNYLSENDIEDSYFTSVNEFDQTQPAWTEDEDDLGYFMALLAGRKVIVENIKWSESVEFVKNELPNALGMKWVPYWVDEACKNQFSCCCGEDENCEDCED